MVRTSKRKGTDEASSSGTNKKPKTVKKQNIAKEETIEREPLKLQDLNDDCLIQIFSYVSRNDLINIVDYNNHFLTVARVVFRKQFSNEVATVTNKFEPEKEQPSESVKLLKFFGCELTKLILNYREEYRRFDKFIEDLIIAVCHKSLMEIEFENANRFALMDIAESFEKLVTVRFTGGMLCKSISKLDKWFPNMNRLELKGQQVHNENGKFIEKHFPALQHFVIENKEEYGAYCGKVSTDNLKAFIALNPQLKSLLSKNDDKVNIPHSNYNRPSFGYRSRAYYDQSEDDDDEDDDDEEGDDETEYNRTGIHIDGETLAFINKKAPGLQKLHLIFRSHGAIKSAPKDELNFKQMKDLTIKFRQPNKLNSLPISCGKIETLELSGWNLHENCLDLIMNNKKAKVVRLTGTWDSTETAVRMISLAASMPRLTELQFPYQNGRIQPGQITSLLNTCKLLKKLTVITEYIDSKKCHPIDTAYSALVTLTGMGWKAASHKTLNKYRRFDYRLVVEKNV